MTYQKRKIRILITAAGSANGINVLQALRAQHEIPVYLVAVDMEILSAGLYLADAHYVVPKASSSVFVPRILKIAKKEKIDIIMPTYSAELPFFAESKEKLMAANLKIAISPKEVYGITENKRVTYAYFRKWNIPFPRLYSDEDIRKGRLRFPVVVKPNVASGSKGVMRAHTAEELSFFLHRTKDPLVQAVAKGEEYTIDGISNLDGKMIVASPRKRLEVRGGLAVKSITVKDVVMVRYAKKIVDGFGIVGPFNVQCFKQGSRLQFIEVNNRFPSGGLPLTVRAGCNVPLLVIKMLLGKRIGRVVVRPGLVMVRYWDALILKKQGNFYLTL